MDTLARKLRECCRGRVLLLGLGNDLFGDDGFGVRLAEQVAGAVRDSSVLQAVVAGASPERFVSERGSWDNVIFADAVEMGQRPGSATILDASAIRARFPQVSTHKLSLGVLARYVESQGRARAWLLGVQPQTVAPGTPLSPPVASAVRALASAVTAQAGQSSSSRSAGK